MLFHLQPLKHIVLLCVDLGHAPQVVLHVLLLNLLHHLRLVLTLLHPQIRIVLVSGLLSPHLIVLVLVRQLLQPFLDIYLLLRLCHNLRETHRQGVLLQVLGVNLLLPHLRKPDLIDVG